MKRISFSASDKLILKFVLKVLFSSVLSVTVYSFIASQIYYRINAGTEKIGLVSLIVYMFSSITISLISVSGFKNNGALIGIVSQILLILYSLFNFVFGDNTLVLFLLKTVLSLVIGAIIGFILSKKKSEFKI